MDHFFDHFRAQHGRQRLALAPEARSRLLSYPWPGNVRQLRNVIDSAVVLATTDVVQPSDLSLHEVGSQQLETLRLDHWEERLIREALQRTGNNINEATQLLGVSRATLYRKLEQYSIQR
jgi:DNA-binding NtrC family response regulator